MKLPKAGDVADLVRLPSVLSVPGDVLLGTTTSARGEHPLRIAGLTAASSCLYMAGMALNDYADRDVDAKERPKRPIPSGRLSAQFALRLASGLSAASLGLAYTAGGRRALEVALPLAATVWAYDLALKKTPWGPLSMAACRSLDILMGSSLGSRKSWLARRHRGRDRGGGQACPQRDRIQTPRPTGTPGCVSAVAGGARAQHGQSRV